MDQSRQEARRHVWSGVIVRTVNACDEAFSFIRRNLVVLILLVALAFVARYPLAELVKYSEAGGEVVGKGLHNLVKHSGLSEAGGAGISLKFEVVGRATVQQLTELEQRLARLEATAGERREASQRPDALPGITQPGEDTVGSALQTAVAELRRNADQAARAAGQTTAELQGWIYVGPVDRAVSAWGHDAPRSIGRTARPPSVGDVVTIAAATNLRAPIPLGKRWHTDAPIVSVLPAGARATVLSLDPVEAINPSTSFLWLNVSVLR